MKDKEYYLNLPYKMVISRLTDPDDSDNFKAYYEEFPHVIGLGKDEAGAIAELKSAFDATIEALLEWGEAIPKPLAFKEKKRINITISAYTLQAIDKIAKNRSAFLEKSAQYMLAHNLL